MKRHYIIYLFTVILLSAGCEDIINPDLPVAEPVMVVDAWINNKPEPQKIRINMTIPYLDNEPLPGVSGAVVTLAGSDGTIYLFTESEKAGEYVWNPVPGTPFIGDIGLDYALSVQMGEEIISGYSRMNRVPVIDSISYRFEEGNQFFPDSYFAQFYASDFLGEGDTYWIRAFKNGVLLNKPDELTVAWDASFSPGSTVDGIPFIQPIREGINPFDEDEDGNFIPPYEIGDSVFVEIHSISNEAFVFLTEVSIQTNRPGGFAELFAQPLSNVPSNILSSDPDRKVVGFFNVSAVSSLGRKIE